MTAFPACAVRVHDETPILVRLGPAQIVEIRETKREVVAPGYVEEKRRPEPGPSVLQGHSEEEPLDFGISAEWADRAVLGAVEEAGPDAARLLAHVLASRVRGDRPWVDQVVGHGAIHRTDPDIHHGRKAGRSCLVMDPRRNRTLGQEAMTSNRQELHLEWGGGDTLLRVITGSEPSSR